ncbi:MAG: DUF1570 domain-containing protein [Lysobacter sp.]|nr:DUF1570 domain-containing protein [Lysobacter sp.]
MNLAALAKYKSLLWMVAIAAAVVAFLFWRAWWLESYRARTSSQNALVDARVAARKRGQPPPPPNARIHDSARYRIITTADAAKTEQVAGAIESLHDRYVEFFREQLPKQALEGRSKKLKLTLYRDRAQFQRYNHSLPWAEAYYLTPMCHAYYVDGAPNPYHWMVHEATHQLNAEVAHFKKAPWIDEGLGTYFGTSRFANGELRLGEIDPDTYPIWWLASFPLDEDVRVDIEQGRWVPLKTLLTGEGMPPMAGRVNQYYVQYWSLTHFLFHYDGGRYADAYKRLIAEGGTLANFEKRIGPVDRIEREWHRYLLGLVNEARERAEASSTNDDAVIVSAVGK